MGWLSALGSLGGSGGGGGGGGLMSGPWGLPSIGGYLGAQQANRENVHLSHEAMNVSATQAQIDRDWQERMSNSAYQRATADMKAAGINPMVAFQQGGASTPGGAMGSAQAAKVENAIGTGLSTAMDALKVNAALKKNGSDIALNDAMATKALADTKTSGASARQMEVNTKAVESQLASIAARAKADAAKAGYDYKASGYDAIMSRANRDAGTANKVMDLFKPGPGKSPRGTYLDGDGAIQKFP